MQSSYPETFERTMSCTEAEWLLWLPRAIGDHAHALQPGAATVQLPPGQLRLRWQVLPERRIALMRLPQLRMAFAFEGVDAQVRHAFMKRFDLYTQRGGG